MRGRFHHQRISCRSDFEETRRMSSFLQNPTTPLAFVLRKLLRDGVLLFIAFQLFRLLN